MGLLPPRPPLIETTGNALSWLQPGFPKQVTVFPAPVKQGMLQGSVLGALLITKHMLPLGEIIKSAIVTWPQLQLLHRCLGTEPYQPFSVNIDMHWGELLLELAVEAQKHFFTLHGVNLLLSVL